MSKINRRAVLAGAASAAVTAPAIAVPTPDPIFAAIKAYELNYAAFLARARYEDELGGRGIKLAAACVGQRKELRRAVSQAGRLFVIASKIRLEAIRWRAERPIRAR